jgi:hypothetical protein
MKIVQYEFWVRVVMVKAQVEQREVEKFVLL